MDLQADEPVFHSGSQNGPHRMSLATQKEMADEMKELCDTQAGGEASELITGHAMRALKEAQELQEDL